MFITWKIESWLVSWNIVQAVKTLWSVECWSLSRSGEGEEVKHSYFPHFEAFLGGLLCAVLCVLCTSSGCRLYWQSKHRPRPGDTWPAPRRSPAVSHTRPPAVTPCHAVSRCCPVRGQCRTAAWPLLLVPRIRTMHCYWTPRRHRPRQPAHTRAANKGPQSFHNPWRRPYYRFHISESNTLC